MKVFVYFAVCLFLLIGCGPSYDSSKFSGVWHRVKYPRETVTVTVDAGNKLIFTTPTFPGSTVDREGQHGEIIGDQVIFNPMLSAKLTATGTMMYGKIEYQRQ